MKGDKVLKSILRKNKIRSKSNFNKCKDNFNNKMLKHNIWQIQKKEEYMDC